MKRITKILSVVLAIVFVLSMTILPSSAALTGDERSKLTFGLAPVVGEVDANGNKSEDNGIYKLSLYFTSNFKVQAIATRFTYPADLLSPINPDMGKIYYEYTCESGYTDVARHVLGTLADDGMYDGSGNVVTSRPKYFGASNTNGNGYDMTADWEKDGQIVFAWAAGDNTLVPGGMENDGVVSFYFKLKNGVTAEQLEGAQFTFIRDDVLCNTVIENPTANMFFQTGAKLTDLPSQYIETVDYTYTAPVPAGPTITKLGSQIRFNSLETPEGGVGSADFDIRTRAKVSKADMITLLSTDEAGLQAALKASGIRMGFVYQATVNGPFIADDAKAAAIAGKDQGTYYVKDVKYAAFEGDDILWTCLIDDAKYDGEVVALPYIILGENAYFLNGDPITCDFSVGYDNKYPSYAA